MGLLVDGVWQDEEQAVRTQDGHFVRPITRYRGWITPDGKPGPSGNGGFAAARGRYHLYGALACPWAHRTGIMRMLKGLEDAVSMSVVEPLYGTHGWKFGAMPGATPDAANGKSELAEIYLLADLHFTGRVTVPVLWDKERRTIVNNESAEIIRMLNSAFGRFTNVTTDYYPQALHRDIDQINELVYGTVNNGVYRAGFASTQAAWRLFTTLIRFDAVYYVHFKCNLRRIVDYPNLSNYLRELYQVPGVAATVNMDHIKTHYYGTHRHLNPRGIIPRGPLLDFTAPHDRGRFPE